MRATPTARELQILAAVIAHGGAKGAAASLGLSQSAVSAALAHVRERLGTATTLQALAVLDDRLEAGWRSPVGPREYRDN